jgi:hypothetical protein
MILLNLANTLFLEPQGCSETCSNSQKSANANQIFCHIMMTEWPNCPEGEELCTSAHDHVCYSGLNLLGFLKLMTVT